MQTITERSPKAEILSAAQELLEGQANQLAALHQRQRILWALLALLGAAELLR
jgi:hypothetical protein